MDDKNKRPYAGFVKEKVWRDVNVERQLENRFHHGKFAVARPHNNGRVSLKQVIDDTTAAMMAIIGAMSNLYANVKVEALDGHQQTGWRIDINGTKTAITLRRKLTHDFLYNHAQLLAQYCVARICQGVGDFVANDRTPAPEWLGEWSDINNGIAYAVQSLDDVVANGCGDTQNAMDLANNVLIKLRDMLMRDGRDYDLNVLIDGVDIVIFHGEGTDTKLLLPLGRIADSCREMAAVAFVFWVVGEACKNESDRDWKRLSIDMTQAFHSVLCDGDPPRPGNSKPPPPSPYGSPPPGSPPPGKSGNNGKKNNKKPGAASSNPVDPPGNASKNNKKKKNKRPGSSASGNPVDPSGTGNKLIDPLDPLGLNKMNDKELMDLKESMRIGLLAVSTDKNPQLDPAEFARYTAAYQVGITHRKSLNGVTNKLQAWNLMNDANALAKNYAPDAKQKAKDELMTEINNFEIMVLSESDDNKLLHELRPFVFKLRRLVRSK
jgi:hypothetical protein